MTAAYDGLAWFYDRYWADRFHQPAEPVLHRLLYRHLRPASRVLDLCCGTGHLSERLLARGYRVTGVDASADMLTRAVRRAPAARFVCADAALVSFTQPAFDAAVSTFDSINHLPDDRSVASLLRNVHGALVPGGWFVFDVNTPRAYESEWGKSSAIVEDDAALFVRGTYDPSSGVGETRLTLFRLEDGWQRADLNVVQRALQPGALREMLRDAGFGTIVTGDAAELGMTGDIAVGRVFLAARRHP